MATFAWPTSPHGRISSGFGPRKSPGGVGSTNHRGIDIAGATYILAAAPGTVTICGRNKYRGYYMTVNHGNGRKTLYQHIREGGYLVSNGAYVQAGQKIALVGSTGAATGPHLHFEVHINGVPVNPMNYSYGTYVAPSTASYSAGTSSPDAMDLVGTSAEEAQKIIHIPQTEKIWTVYETDTVKREMDDYAVTWQSIRTGKVRDITSRVSGLTLTDDAGSLCQELQFSLAVVTDTVNVARIEADCGDYIAVVNHGSKTCIFLGQIQDTERTGETQSVRCLDQGRLLTANEIILQCNNIPAKTAIEQAAARAGIRTVSCPNLISSVYNVYKDSAAGIIQSILETVTAENGVPYFPRMMGDTLVIRSYGAAPIRGFYRQAPNVASFDVLDEAGVPTVQRSIEDLRNAVTVYSEADDAVSVKATAEDTESIKLYGRRQALETWSDQDTATASAKAKTTLAARNREDEEVRLLTYGSDKIVAGCRLRLDMETVKGDYWVTAVTHQLGQPHLMDLTLRRAT